MCVLRLGELALLPGEYSARVAAAVGGFRCALVCELLGFPGMVIFLVGTLED